MTSHAADGPMVVLIGMPGAGKSTVGAALAAALGVPFADSDDLVAKREGRDVQQIFATDGEAAFRQLEASVVQSALTTFRGVLALGGGAVTNVRVRTALRESGVRVVLLKATLPALLVRVGDGSSRPLLSADPRGRLAELEASRASHYDEVATDTVDTTGRSIAEVREAIDQLIGQRA